MTKWRHGPEQGRCKASKGEKKMGGASGARLVGEEGEREPSHCGCSPRLTAMKAHTSKPRHQPFLSTLVLPGGSAASEVLARVLFLPFTHTSDQLQRQRRQRSALHVTAGASSTVRDERSIIRTAIGFV